MNAGNNALKIWQSFCNFCETGFECRMIHHILYSVKPKRMNIKFWRPNPLQRTYLALIAGISRSGMQSHMRNNLFPIRKIKAESKRIGICGHQRGSCICSKVSTAYRFLYLRCSGISNDSEQLPASARHQTNLQVRQGLPIKYKSLSFLHRIVDIEILHAQNVFINVQLAQVPRSRFDTELLVAMANPPYHCS